MSGNLKYHDDGRELPFTSVVYANVQQYFSDCLICATNENYSRDGLRSADERMSILKKKIEAERRLERHEQAQGTIIHCISYTTKKGSH